MGKLQARLSLLSLILGEKKKEEKTGGNSPEKYRGKKHCKKNTGLKQGDWILVQVSPRQG